MPVIRVKRMRESKRIQRITPEYLGHLRASDFLGELTEEEIPVAKELGVYSWDPIVKGWRARK